MVKLYVSKIMAGSLTLSKVPASRKADVIAAFQEKLDNEEITQNQFDQYTRDDVA